MKLEAVTVCVGYADFLREVAPHNLPHFARWTVVTSPRDAATQAVCREYGVNCIESDEHQRDGSFSKGRAINRGLAQLTQADWVLHLDADIALPADLDPILADAHLDPANIYGCDRVNVQGHAVWDKVRQRGLMSRRNEWAVHIPHDGVVGTRVANVGHGYTPIGFFQLWQGRRGLNYPQTHGTAARTDVQHALQWDRRNRVLIPELIVWHLESAAAKMGANWAGRTTPPFRPGAVISLTKEKYK